MQLLTSIGSGYATAQRVGTEELGIHVNGITANLLLKTEGMTPFFQRNTMQWLHTFCSMLTLILLHGYFGLGSFQGV